MARLFPCRFKYGELEISAEKCFYLSVILYKFLFNFFLNMTQLRPPLGGEPLHIQGGCSSGQGRLHHHRARGPAQVKRLSHEIRLE